jgi:hypothetical protein
MSKKNLGYFLFLLLLVTTLACGSITRRLQQVQEVKETVESVATFAKDLITESAPLIETVQAVATENLDIVETVEAVVTENPGIIETVEGIATQGFNLGNLPDDIPVVDQSTVSNFVSTGSTVFYSTSLDFQSVVDFYKSQMPANGWEEDTNMTFEMQGTSTLGYTKDNSSVAIVIYQDPANENLTYVTVTIIPK